MAEILSSDDVDALFTLIYWLRDQPVQTSEGAGLLRSQEVLRRTKALNDVHEFAPSVARPMRPSRGPNNLTDHIAATARSMDRWFTVGDPPAVLPMASIQFKLIAAKAEALEKAFLGVVCRHFGDQFGVRYRVLVDRATECGVYPLLEVTKAPLATTGSSSDHFDDDVTEATARSELPAAALRPKTTLMDRSRFASAPEGARVDQTRRARNALFEKKPPSVMTRLWDIFNTREP